MDREHNPAEREGLPGRETERVRFPESPKEVVEQGEGLLEEYEGRTERLMEELRQVMETSGDRDTALAALEIKGSLLEADAKARGETQEVMEEAEKEGTGERFVGKTDEMFGELLDKIKDHPKIKEEVVKAAIEQMRMIAAQMRDVRSAKNIQELKMLMVKHQKELRKACGDDEEMLQAVDEWGREFIESKAQLYDMINEYKEGLAEESQELQVLWSAMEADMGKIIGLFKKQSRAGSTGYQLDRLYDNIVFGSQSGRIQQQMMDVVNAGRKRRGEEEIATAGPLLGVHKITGELQATETGYESAEFPDINTAEFARDVGLFVKQAMEGIYSGQGITPEQTAEMSGVVDNIQRNFHEFTRKLSELSKVFNRMKKVRDIEPLRSFESI